MVPWIGTLYVMYTLHSVTDMTITIFTHFVLDDSTPRHLLDKHEKYNELITYLVQSSIWSHLTNNAQHTITCIGEQLYVTQYLRSWLHQRIDDDDEILYIRRTLISSVMNSIIQQHKEEQHLQEGWNRADLFFSHVTTIYETIPAMIQAASNNETSIHTHTQHTHTHTHISQTFTCTFSHTFTHTRMYKLTCTHSLIYLLHRSGVILFLDVLP
jgi:hypothetical protein